VLLGGVFAARPPLWLMKYVQHFACWYLLSSEQAGTFMAFGDVE
jgi:hypothetical protein